MTFMGNSKPIRIKPVDKNLPFTKSDDIERFLGDFDDSACIGGASDMDKCTQVKLSIPDREMKNVIEGMEGCRGKSRLLLTWNMMEIWDSGLLPPYTLNNLNDLRDQLRSSGGVNNHVVNVKFQRYFWTMLSHLRTSDQVENGDPKMIGTKYHRDFPWGNSGEGCKYFDTRRGSSTQW